MIRSRNRQSEQSFDALTVSAEIRVLGGNERQIFIPVPTPGTYEDDRRLVPCILGGYVSVADPAGIMGGEVTLTDIEWYDREPTEGDYATGRITNPSQIPAEAAAYREIDYLISDGSGSEWCAGVPKHCLIIHKNLPEGAGQTIYGVLKFTDQRTGDTVRITKSKALSTSGYDNEATVLRGPDTPDMMIDALAVPDSVPSGRSVLDVAWTRRIAVQMVGAEGDVADNEACYLWTVWDEALQAWRNFSEVEMGCMIADDRAKELTFDARMVAGTVALRCYACRRSPGGAWTDPRNEDSPFYDCRVSQKMNNRITADPVQTGGVTQDLAMQVPCTYRMDIRYNGKPVPEEKLCLFIIHWYSVGLVTRNGVKVYVKNDMGCGPTMEFTPCDLGYTYHDGFTVYAELLCFTGCKPVTGHDSYTYQNGVLTGVGTAKYVKYGDSFVISPDFG